MFVESTRKVLVISNALLFTLLIMGEMRKEYACFVVVVLPLQCGEFN
jgi:hypothetical protein